MQRSEVAAMLLCERHGHCVARLFRVLGSAEWTGLCAALVQVDALPAFVAQSAHTQTHDLCQIPHPRSVRTPSHSKALKGKKVNFQIYFFTLPMLYAAPETCPLNKSTVQTTLYKTCKAEHI